MLPWSPEFAWDVPHLLFFGALYAVVATIAATLGLAVLRSRRDAREGRTGAVVWHADFEDLPSSARACRHQITGEAPGRVCERAFDCRACREHRALEALRRERPVEAPRAFAFDVPLDRLYHRGHTWARPEKDGLVTVGLDEVGVRLLGPDAEVALPALGVPVQANAPLATVRSRGRETRLLSPVDGTVVDVRPDGPRFMLRVDPGPVLDLRHLLYADEAQAWALRELERLEAACGGPAGPALADGGELVPDVGAAVPPERYDTILGDLFLEP
jgi:hypothetical protein